jgi:uncharacterized protein YkwD
MMFLQLNWVDWVIIAVLLYEAYQGWEAGFIYLASSFISFAVALWVAIASNNLVSTFFTEKFGIASAWSVLLAYIGVAFAVNFIMTELFVVIISRIPEKIVHSKYTSWIGVIVSILNGAVIVAFFLLIILALPLRGTIKNDINVSRLGGYIVTIARQYGGPMQATLDEVGKAAAKFITIDPKSTERLTLDVAPKESDLKVDVADERILVNMVNAERISMGVTPVSMSDELTQVARAHSRDMFLRRYFAHNTPEGKTPGDRITEAGIIYHLAGENLAYAPSVTVAHSGLMNSPEHKKNILDPEFRHIGIGIISTDSFGLMVTQDFTN